MANVATGIVFLQIIASIPFISGDIKCKLGEKYTCDEFKTIINNVTAFTEDVSICKGVCVKMTICSGEWSPWKSVETTGRIEISKYEKRLKLCDTDVAGEHFAEIRKSVQGNVGAKNKLRFLRKRGSPKSEKKKKAELEMKRQKIEKKIDARLIKLNVEQAVAIGEQLRLKCEMPEEDSLRKLFPNITLRWVFNNQKLKIDERRVKLYETLLVISEFTPYDQGLYLCQIEYPSKARKTVFFATVVSLNLGKPVSVYVTNSLKLWCPSSPLGRMFDNSFRTWYLKGDIKYHGIPAALRIEEMIYNVSYTDAGLWTCRVKDKTNVREWNLIRYQVTVGPLPEPENKFTKFVKTHPVLIGTQSFGALAFLFVLYIIFVRRPEKEEYVNENTDTALLVTKDPNDLDMTKLEENGIIADDELSIHTDDLDEIDLISDNESDIKILS